MSFILVAAIASMSDGIIAPGAKLELLGDGYSFTEGPATDKDGNVYFTDQPNDRIMKWSTDGKIVEWMKPCGRSNGMYFDAKGNLIACADDKNELWSISPDKKVTVLVKDFDAKLLNGPNDVWVHPNGDMYFTDPLYERPYWSREKKQQQTGQGVYLLRNGKVTSVDQDLTKSNGIIGTADGKTLYVADIGADKTYRYDIQKDATLANKTLFCNMGSDGMTLDSKGNLYLTGKGVNVFDKDGKQIEQIDVPQGWTANVTFAGKDRKLLFITAGTGVYGLKMAVKGL
ncbi:MAG: SMP-30/gluconolactonase/LRE family protein [Chlorobia bacterium]|nr:SMP-30/gluconolactonase/LRE family protein [Fimbriimonadaceae bacterium]